MQTAEVVLGVLRERGRKGLPCTQLYRQMFNRENPAYVDLGIMWSLAAD